MWPFNEKITKTKARQVKCSECRHYIDEYDAQIVLSGLRTQYSYAYAEVYYCPMHKKPYDKTVLGKFYKQIPAREVQVTEAGEEIK